jgi:hypothetical protein
MVTFSPFYRVEINDNRDLLSMVGFRPISYQIGTAGLSIFMEWVLKNEFKQCNLMPFLLQNHPSAGGLLCAEANLRLQNSNKFASRGSAPFRGRSSE